MTESNNDEMDRLFDRWKRRLGISDRERFVRDGIVDEEMFRVQRCRIVFLLAEPNLIPEVKATGNDLRVFYRSVVSSNCFYQRLARWTRLLLDGQTVSFKGDPKGACAQLRRIATVNLKKVGGGGFADPEAVADFAWRHRDHLVRQLELIAPDSIIACGGHVRRAIRKVLSDDLKAPMLNDPLKCDNGACVLPSDHPSCMKGEADADKRLRLAWAAAKTLSNLRCIA